MSHHHHHHHNSDPKPVERYTNPVVGSNIRLRLLTYNSNNRVNIDSIDKIEIYFLDPTEISERNPDGRRLVQTFDGSLVIQEDVGLYSIIVTAVPDQYTIGNYIDIWYATFDSESSPIENNFAIYPNLWFTTTTPIVYDFNFAFRPNRIKRGSKRWLVIEVTPNVPSHSELMAYYENIAIISPITVSIEKNCGECVPLECDDNIIVENAPVELREKCLGYYFLDTTDSGLDLDCGIYDLSFSINLGESTYVSENQQLQIS